MDTSDPAISFGSDGVCSHCTTFDSRSPSSPLDEGQRAAALQGWIETIKRAGKGRPYDCIVGMSGGVDSTYVVLLAKRYGLRPLAVHLDNGWDSEIAVSNIHRALERLGVDLVTEVLDWNEFRGLQVAFLKASTPDSEIPTDHAIIATVFKTAWSRGIDYAVMGHNRATEVVHPAAWSQGHFDWRYIRSVNEAYGTGRLRTFPHLSFPAYVRYRVQGSRRVFNILDYVPYSRKRAIAELEAEVGWRSYGGKHHESVYTRFFQAHILPVKFGFDKRRAHLSSQILSGEVSRAQALEEMARPPYPSMEAENEDRAYVIKKLGLGDAEFEAIMKAPPKRYQDYPNMENSRGYTVARAAYRRVSGIVRSMAT